MENNDTHFDSSACGSACDILGDLLVTDIRPILSHLSEFIESHLAERTDYLSWNELKAIAACLEKNTRGRVVTSLSGTDLEGLRYGLQFGIGNFGKPDSERMYDYAAMLMTALTRKATLSFLRVSINLTNSSSEICEKLNKDLALAKSLTEVITADPEHYSHAYHHEEREAQTVRSAEDEQEQEMKESKFDLLLLCLGLMINFVQESVKVKEMFVASELSVEIRAIFEKLIAKDVRLLLCSADLRGPQITLLDIWRSYSRISSSQPKVAKLLWSRKR